MTLQCGVKINLVWVLNDDSPRQGLVLLKTGVRVFIIGERTAAEYITGIAARHDASCLEQSSSSSVTSMCAKTLSRFWSTGASSVPVLMIHQLLVTSCT